MSRAEVELHLAQAATRAENADAREHIGAALELLDTVGECQIRTCPACGTTGLPEQLYVHDCPGA